MKSFPIGILAFSVVITVAGASVSVLQAADRKADVSAQVEREKLAKAATLRKEADMLAVQQREELAKSAVYFSNPPLKTGKDSRYYYDQARFFSRRVDPRSSGWEPFSLRAQIADGKQAEAEALLAKFKLEYKYWPTASEFIHAGQDVRLLNITVGGFYENEWRERLAKSDVFAYVAREQREWDQGGVGDDVRTVPQKVVFPGSLDHAAGREFVRSFFARHFGGQLPPIEISDVTDRGQFMYGVTLLGPSDHLGTMQSGYWDRIEITLSMTRTLNTKGSEIELYVGLPNTHTCKAPPDRRPPKDRFREMDFEDGYRFQQTLCTKLVQEPAAHP